MPVVIPDGFGEVTYVFTGGPSDPMTVVLGVDPVAGLSANDIADLAAQAWTIAVATNPRQYQHSSVVIDKVTARRNNGGVIETGEKVVGLTGLASGQPLTWNTSVLVKKKTGLGGRANQGRLYYMGGNEDWVTDGSFIEATPLGLLQTAFTNMYNDLVADQIPPVVLHSNPAVAPTPVTGFEVQSRLATQRRRLR